MPLEGPIFNTMGVIDPLLALNQGLGRGGPVDGWENCSKSGAVKPFGLPHFRWFSSPEAESSHSRSEMAAGGTALIYRVQRSADWCEVQKILLPKFQGKREFEELQVREYEILKSLSHPLILKAIRLEEASCPKTRFQTQILSLESLEAVTLSDLGIFLEGLAPSTRQIWADQFLAQLLSAVQYLQSRRVVHGDLCPENILIEKSGFIKLIDFATADAPQAPTHHFHVHGKPLFRAPELKASGQISAEGDLYAVGKIYEFVVGEDLAFRPVNQARISSLIDERRIPEVHWGNWFAGLAPLPEDSFFVPKFKNRPATLLMTEKSSLQGIWQQARSVVALGLLAFSLTSWMPQMGWVSVSALPMTTKYSIDVLGAYNWTERPIRSKRVPAGRVQVFFRHSGSKDVVQRDIMVLPGEHVKVIEDFRGKS